MRKEQGAVFDRRVGAISGVSVTVYNHGTTDKPTIYSDNGITPQANPFQTDSLGRWAFYVANGRYDIEFSGSAINTFKLEDVLIEQSVGGVTDHGGLTGLTDDDHTQYLLADGSRNAAKLIITDGADHYLQVPQLTTTQRDALTPVNGMIIYNTSTAQFERYQAGAWAAFGGVTDHGGLTGLTDDDHTQYLLADGSRNAAKLIITDGADHYLQVPQLTTTQRDALTPVNGMIIYNTSTAQFERYQAGAWAAFGGVTDHGGLTGLTDDDHTQYLLADGSRNAAKLIITDGADHYLQVPQLTTTQRDALTPVNGMIIYNTSTAQFERYQAGAWAAFGGVTDHGGLTGLTDDDHTQYLLADGSRNAAKLIITDGADHYLQVPQLTTTQRDALTPVNGMIIYNTSTAQFERYQAGAWAAFGSGGGGAEIWTAGPSFTRVSDSSFTVTDNAPNQAIFKKGRPIRYSDDGSTWVYGIVTNYVTGTVTLAGAPMTTAYDAYIQYGDFTRVIQLDIPINGWFEDADDPTLIANDLFSTIKWQLGTAYCVKFSVIEKTLDSGAEPIVNVLMAGAGVSTSNGGVGLTANNSWVDTVVDISASNYDINYGEAIEIAVDKQGNGNARDLTVSIVFVLG